MACRDLLAEREAEPGAGRRAPTPTEALEDLREIRRRDAGAVVVHLDRGRAVVRAHREAHGGGGWRVAARIAPETPHQAREEVRGAAPRHRALALGREAPPLPP